jgi:hypothetical protein
MDRNSSRRYVKTIMRVPRYRWSAGHCRARSAPRSPPAQPEQEQHNDDGADAVALDHLTLFLSRSCEFRRTDMIPGYGTASSNNGVTHGEAYALSRRPVALFDHAMDARGNRRTV